ncbi:hypothetical protein EDD18DRAFT_1181740, partial [Armillaria luteobubalina]
IYEPVLVKDLGPEKTTQLSSGQQHSITLGENSTVRVWGCNEYRRHGLSNQVDTLRPKQVLHCPGANTGVLLTAGPSTSVVVDRGVMYWITSNWKNSGDGSSDSPYSGFRYMLDIKSCKIPVAPSEALIHWALTSDNSGDGDTTLS